MAKKKVEDLQEETVAPETTAVAEEVVVSEAPVEEAVAPVAEVAVAEEAEEAPVQQEAQPEAPRKSNRAAAAVKEWIRKRVVGLKRNPQRIPFICFVIVSFVWLFMLFTFSQTAAKLAVEMGGLTVFVNTLLSILILALFLNAFPKRKKPNLVLIVLIGVFIAAIIAMDILYYINAHHFIYGYTDAKGEWHNPGLDAAGLEGAPYAPKSLNLAIAHIVLQGISAIIFALYPVYKRLLQKINTRKEIESNDINEAIDIEEED